MAVLFIAHGRRARRRGYHSFRSSDTLRAPNEAARSLSSFVARAEGIGWGSVAATPLVRGTEGTAYGSVAATFLSITRA